MTDHNSYRELVPVSSQSPCHTCGKLVDIESKNACRETTRRLWRHDEAGTVWHQGCFNTFLGEG
ncbi:MAG: hypothetical protein EWM73_00966 [Nitrospira sp.]|nr:MAG: hypothetical protein EWM73_00966 [Nitrospira sp.]